MEKFEKHSLPKACKCLEKFLEKNPKDEVYCVENKVSYFVILLDDVKNLISFIVLIGWDQANVLFIFNLL